MDIGYVVFHFLEKYVLEVSKYKASHDCGESQVYKGVAASIEVGMHIMFLVWLQHFSE